MSLARYGEDGKLIIPLRVEYDLPGGGTAVGEAMQEVGPDHPQYATYLAYLRSHGATHVGADDDWTLTGQIDTGQRVTLPWRGGITDWPPEALDWAMAAMAEGHVMLDDGPGLFEWLRGQGFVEAV